MRGVYIYQSEHIYLPEGVDEMTSIWFFIHGIERVEWVSGFRIAEEMEGDGIIRRERRLTTTS